MRTYVRAPTGDPPGSAHPRGAGRQRLRDRPPPGCAAGNGAGLATSDVRPEAPSRGGADVSTVLASVRPSRVHGRRLLRAAGALPRRWPHRRARPNTTASHLLGCPLLGDRGRDRGAPAPVLPAQPGGRGGWSRGPNGHAVALSPTPRLSLAAAWCREEASAPDRARAVADSADRGCAVRVHPRLPSARGLRLRQPDGAL